jgi:hypothetical protein
LFNQDGEKHGVAADVDAEGFRRPPADTLNQIIRCVLFCEERCTAHSHGLTRPSSIWYQLAESPHEPSAGGGHSIRSDPKVRILREKDVSAPKIPPHLQEHIDIKVRADNYACPLEAFVHFMSGEPERVTASVAQPLK